VDRDVVYLAAVAMSKSKNKPPTINGSTWTVPMSYALFVVLAGDLCACVTIIFASQAGHS
jgi:hypothetical protein